MRVHEYEVGLKKEEIDTPSLLLDLPAMERNLQTMAGFFQAGAVKVRPHVKLHKATPILAHMQLQAGGAVGVTCSKLAEAEVMASAGIRDILIANQIAGERKIRRLVNLATYTDVMVAVDSYENVAELSQAAEAQGVRLRVLVELNIGHNRCGVEPFEPALKMARAVQASPGLRFTGLMAYDGHCTMKVKASEREACSRQANEILAETRAFIEQAGIPVEIVSASGTFTYRYASQVKGITEIQAGSYLLMDTAFRESGVTDFECCLTVLATVTSRPTWKGAEDLAIVDVGRKAMDLFYGLPTVKEPQGATVVGLSQEHGRLRLEGPARSLRVGDKVEIWVRDANGTINLYDRFHAVRNGVVEAVWDIPLRGRTT